jgi:hypothetical protein
VSAAVSFSRRSRAGLTNQRAGAAAFFGDVLDRRHSRQRVAPPGGEWNSNWLPAHPPRQQDWRKEAAAQLAVGADFRLARSGK